MTRLRLALPLGLVLAACSPVQSPTDSGLDALADSAPADSAPADSPADSAPAAPAQVVFDLSVRGSARPE